jgi:hypothetical protein
MIGKRAKDVFEIRADIKVRTFIGIKPVDIHREVCDIYGVVGMSHKYTCRSVAKFKTDQLQVKDTTTQGQPATTKTKSNREKNQEYGEQRCLIHYE